MSKKLRELNIIGIGASGNIEDLTVGALELLKKCDPIFFVCGINMPVIKSLKKQKKTLIDISYVYELNELSSLHEVYHRMAEIVVDSSKTHRRTAFCSWGNPAVFCSCATIVRKKAQRAGIKVNVIPGLSCLDMIYCKLNIDPGYGMQILEASRLIAGVHKINPGLPALLLQIGQGMRKEFHTPSLEQISAALQKCLPKKYKVELILLLQDKTYVLSTQIKDLPKHYEFCKLHPTMYIPPLKK